MNTEHAGESLSDWHRSANRCVAASYLTTKREQHEGSTKEMQETHKTGPDQNSS
jgi:hypothetical protein